MATSYPEGHIPQDIYEKAMEEKRIKDKKILAARAKPKPKKEPTKIIKTEVNKPTEKELWDLKYNEQIKLLRELGDYNTYEIRKSFRYEKERVKELMRLYKDL